MASSDLRVKGQRFSVSLTSSGTKSNFRSRCDDLKDAASGKERLILIGEVLTLGNLNGNASLTF